MGNNKEKHGKDASNPTRKWMIQKEKDAFDENQQQI